MKTTRLHGLTFITDAQAESRVRITTLYVSESCRGHINKYKKLKNRPPRIAHISLTRWRVGGTELRAHEQGLVDVVNSPQKIVLDARKPRRVWDLCGLFLGED